MYFQRKTSTNGAVILIRLGLVGEIFPITRSDQVKAWKGLVKRRVAVSRCCGKAHLPTYPLGLPTPVQRSHLATARFAS